MKSVLITGCSSGFGRASALALARGGARVFATMRDPADGQDLAAAARAENLALSVHRLDVADPDSVDRCVAEIDTLGPIDALVNNAGRGLRGPVTTMSDEDIQSLFEVNVYGVLRMVRAIAPTMRERRSGTIVNVTSLAGVVGAPFEGGYCASKHAVEALSEAMRWELAPYGIRVVVIEPGAYRTEFFTDPAHTSLFGADHPERAMFEFFSAAMARTMFADHHLQDPSEVAGAITRAVTEDNGPFRRIVGRDAERICGLRRTLSYEAYEQAIRDIFDLHGAAGLVDSAR